MLTRLKANLSKTWLIEGSILAVSAPFLLFPSRLILATFLALLGLIFIEVMPVALKWRPIPSPTPLDLVLLLLSFVFGISILVSADLDLTLEKASGVLLGMFSLRYLLRTINSQTLWRWGLLLFGIMGAGFVLLGILNADWLNKIPLFTPIIEKLPNQIVAIPGQPNSGIHPNQIAGTLLFYIPLAWAVFFGHQSATPRLQKWLWFGLSVISSAALILTQSRSGWLGGAASLVLLIVLWIFSLPKKNSKRRQLIILVGTVMIALFAAILLIGPDYLLTLWEDPAQETAVGSLNSLGFRQELWRWTIVAIQDFPFTGVGLGSFRVVIRRLYPLAIDPGYDVAHAHNVFFHTAIDIGILGLVVYLALIGMVVILGIQAAKNSASSRPYALGLTAGLIAFHIYGIGDTLAFGSKTGLAFWLLLGLIVSLYQISANKPDINSPANS